MRSSSLRLSVEATNVLPLSFWATDINTVLCYADAVTNVVAGSIVLIRNAPYRSHPVRCRFSKPRQNLAAPVELEVDAVGGLMQIRHCCLDDIVPSRMAPVVS
jgi:hypothetical protein